MYDLGIIGGMGPLATSEIYHKIIDNTLALADQDHMSIVILNKPAIPDRSAAILNNAPSPVAALNESIEELVNLKVYNFIIACNTAHYFLNELKIPKSINFINMIDEVLLNIKKEYSNYDVIVLATMGTINANIYKTNENSKDLNIVYPDPIYQEHIMNYIYNIKNGKDILYDINNFEKILEKIKNNYKKSIFLLACTELSMLYKHLNKKFVIKDAVSVLVEAVIKRCGYNLK